MAVSIQNRLTAGLLLTITLLLLTQWFLGSLAIRYLVEDLVEARLGHDIESILGAIQFDQSGQPSLKSPSLNAIYQQPLSGHYFQVLSGENQLRSRSLWDTSLEIEPIAVGSAVSNERMGPAKQPLLILSKGYSKSGQSLTIQVAEDLSLANERISTLQNYHAGFSIIAILILILIQRLVIRSSLRPFGEIRSELKALERGEVLTLSTPHPDEIVPLVSEINHLLSVMKKRLQRSRKSAGNLAHGLKAPLAVLMQQADVPSLRADEKTANTIRNQIGVIGQLIDRELNRARLAGGERGYRTQIRQELDPLIETLSHIYADKELEFELNIPTGAYSSMDTMDMVEMLGNLLDNACKYASKKISINYEAGDTEIWQIQDDGPGIEEDQVMNLLQRGARLDESTQGHGLGLAIVRDIVTDYSGEIELSRSEKLGGLKIHICY